MRLPMPVGSSASSDIRPARARAPCPAATVGATPFGVQGMAHILRVICPGRGRLREARSQAQGWRREARTEGGGRQTLGTQGALPASGECGG